MNTRASHYKTRPKQPGIFFWKGQVLLVAPLLTLLLICAPLWAQENQTPSIAVPAIMNGRAMVVINGDSPKVLAIGQSYQGIKLTAIQDNQALFTVTMPNGGIRNMTIRIGAMPVSLSNAPPAMNSGNDEISIPVGPGGHFYTWGFINNKPVNFLVDTGATRISMGEDDARRLGIDYESGRPSTSGTANGRVTVHVIHLNPVRIQNVEILDVEAHVAARAPMPEILLGNSFLNRFDMLKTHNRLILRRRY